MIKQGTSKQLKLEKLTVEEIGTRGFRQTVPSQTEKHNLVKFQKFQVRGTWAGAPSIPLKALEVDEVGSTGPYENSQFARKLWLENENLADDRFERDDGDEDEDLNILFRKDQQYEILFNEPAEIVWSESIQIEAWKNRFRSQKESHPNKAKQSSAS